MSDEGRIATPTGAHADLIGFGDIVTGMPRSHRSAAWRAVSATTSATLVVGAIVYGIALGIGGPDVSPVTVAPVSAAAPPAKVTDPQPNSPVRNGDGRGRGDGRDTGRGSINS